MRDWIRERIPEPVIALERSHDLLSTPASANGIGRNVTANDRRGEYFLHPLPKINKFQNVDSNNTSSNQN